MTWWSEPLRAVVAGRRVVLLGGVPAATEGPGVTVAPAAPPWIGERPAASSMEILRGGLRVMREPPAGLVACVDEFDPGATALVIRTFLADVPTFLGRALLAYRRADWLALEDKVVVDALWDRAGVARRPSRVVPIEDAGRAATNLDAGEGMGRRRPRRVPRWREPRALGDERRRGGGCARGARACVRSRARHAVRRGHAVFGARHRAARRRGRPAAGRDGHAATWARAGVRRLLDVLGSAGCRP
jgi:hypothetical protein